MAFATNLKTRIREGETECLILGLLAHIIAGFEFTSIFLDGFILLLPQARMVELTSLILIFLAIGLLLAPFGYRRLGELDTVSLQYERFLRKAGTVGLLPFALALGIEVYVAAYRIAGQTIGLVAGCVVSIAAASLWFGAGWLARALNPNHFEDTMPSEYAEKLSIDERIDSLLLNIRTVLVGVQALLGFQFAAALTTSFQRLPVSVRYVHLASLLTIALAAVLLMAPAAFQRIVASRDRTESALQKGTRFLLIAMGLLAIGAGAEIFVVAFRVVGSALVAQWIAGLMFGFFVLSWFGVGFWERFTR